MEDKPTVVIRFEIQNRHAAKAFWDAHTKHEEINGCIVTGITWEDLFKHRCDEDDEHERENERQREACIGRNS